MISRSTLFIILSVICLSISSLAHADAPVVDGTADYNGNNQADNGNISSDNASNRANDNSSNNNAADYANNSVNNVDNSNATNSSGIDTSSMSLNDRVAKLEHQVSNMNQLNLLQQVNQLQQQVQDLTGRLDVATHTIQVLQQQQKMQYADIDQRLSQYKSGNNIGKPIKPVTIAANVNAGQDAGDNGTANNAAAANDPDLASANPDQSDVNNNVDQSAANSNATVDANAAANSPVDADVANNGNAADSNSADSSNSANSDAQNAYAAAYNAIKNKNYNGATKGMVEYLQQYPNDHNAVNAHYWLGELYLLQGKPSQAATEFDAVITQYPKNAKTADSMLKLGFAYADLHKWQQAHSQLQLVQQQFSGTNTAQLASARLQEMKLQGH